MTWDRVAGGQEYLTTQYRCAHTGNLATKRETWSHKSQSTMKCASGASYPHQLPRGCTFLLSLLNAHADAGCRGITRRCTWWLLRTSHFWVTRSVFEHDGQKASACWNGCCTELENELREGPHTLVVLESGHAIHFNASRVPFPIGRVEQRDLRMIC